MDEEAIRQRIGKIADAVDLYKLELTPKEKEALQIFYGEINRSLFAAGQDAEIMREEIIRQATAASPKGSEIAQKIERLRKEIKLKGEQSRNLLQ
jgi:hypothetical protein